MEVVTMGEQPGEWTLRVKSRYRNSKLISIAWKDKTKMHKMKKVTDVMVAELELSFRMPSL